MEALCRLMSPLVLRGGKDDAVFDGGLIGVRLNRDAGGLSGVWQPGLDRLPADHDGTADRYPPADGEPRGQLAWMSGDDHHAKSRGNPAMPVTPSSGRARGTDHNAHLCTWGYGAGMRANGAGSTAARYTATQRGTPAGGP